MQKSPKAQLVDLISSGTAEDLKKFFDVQNKHNNTLLNSSLDHQGRTALHMCIANNRQNLIPTLLELGANPTIWDQLKQTPLIALNNVIIANLNPLDWDNIKYAMLLIIHGANPEEKDKDDFSFIDVLHGSVGLTALNSDLSSYLNPAQKITFLMYQKILHDYTFMPSESALSKNTHTLFLKSEALNDADIDTLLSVVGYYDEIDIDKKNCADKTIMDVLYEKYDFLENFVKAHLPARRHPNAIHSPSFVFNHLSPDDIRLELLYRNTLKKTEERTRYLNLLILLAGIYFNTDSILHNLPLEIVLHIVKFILPIDQSNKAEEEWLALAFAVFNQFETIKQTANSSTTIIQAIQKLPEPNQKMTKFELVAAPRAPALLARRHLEQTIEAKFPLKKTNFTFKKEDLIQSATDYLSRFDDPIAKLNILIQFEHTALFKPLRHEIRKKSGLSLPAKELKK